MLQKQNDDFERSFAEIVKMIETRRNNALVKVNDELISLYWEVGQYISDKTVHANWGKSIVKNLSQFIAKTYPTLTGFSWQNMYRMKKFYESYKDLEKFSALLRKISWTNNLIILSGAKTVEEREFYISLAIKEKWKSRELERQIRTGYFERYMLAENKNLPYSKEKMVDETEIPNVRFLDTYNLEFLNLKNNYSERDLRKAIISNFKSFVLEVGKGFTYIGEEYKVSVGNSDFFIDLLFYNRDLSCLVAFELKVGKFIPEYISKMDLYLEALDRQEKKPHENPSVGVILCAGKDDEVVEYAMSRTLSQTMVAEYKTKLIDKKLLEDKLKQITEIMESSNIVEKEDENVNED